MLSKQPGGTSCLAPFGLGLSLLATVVMYHAGKLLVGLSLRPLLHKVSGCRGRFPAGTVRLAYLLAVLGFGTKVGFFPVHTWLPDAHSEAPTPVSALLSGALLATCFYAILRYYQITERSAGVAFARDVLVASGSPLFCWARRTGPRNATRKGCSPTRLSSTWASLPSA